MLEHKEHWWNELDAEQLVTLRESTWLSGIDSKRTDSGFIGITRAAFDHISTLCKCDAFAGPVLQGRALRHNPGRLGDISQDMRSYLQIWRSEETAHRQNQSRAGDTYQKEGKTLPYPFVPG